MYSTYVPDCHARLGICCRPPYCVSNLHFQSDWCSKEGVCSREKHFCTTWSICFTNFASPGSKLNPCVWSFWRYSSGSYSSGPSAIQPAATCKASTTWSLRSLSSTFSSTLVSSSRSILSVTCCRSDSLLFFFSLQDLLLIEHFYTRHDFRAEGSWHQVSENEPQDPLRLCFLSSRISLPFCSLSCFVHLSTLISVRSGSFRLDLCLIVLWNTIYPSMIRLWEPGLQTPHRPTLGSFCWCSATAFFSLFSDGKVAKLNKEPETEAQCDRKVITVFPGGSCRNSSALHKS